ncbi:MAG: GNAT family N-acetyltransferase [Candidatus Eremiobacteraeota bacterium]|nr:GNAT family N-acetyltransferase [Candidatus Eremiobacteraeota bacterium]
MPLAKMQPWFPITTERLLLREYTPADEADVHEYACDPLVSRYDSWGPNTEEETHRAIQRWLLLQQMWPRDIVQLAAELRETGKAIGSVRLWTISEDKRTAEIGYTFNRRYWNKGYATEAASALLIAAFRDLDMHRVVANCDTRNTASWRVMERIGMRREGCFLRERAQKGEWRDTYSYAILADEWRKL